MLTGTLRRLTPGYSRIEPQVMFQFLSCVNVCPVCGGAGDAAHDVDAVLCPPPTAQHCTPCSRPPHRYTTPAAMPSL